MPEAMELPIYEGKPNVHISDYTNTFQRIKNANNWDDELALDHLKCSLRGYAANWLCRYESIQANTTKNQVLTDLKSRFHSTENCSQRPAAEMQWRITGIDNALCATTLCTPQQNFQQYPLEIPSSQKSPTLLRETRSAGTNDN
jgi:hypothetical protein